MKVKRKLCRTVVVVLFVVVFLAACAPNMAGSPDGNETPLASKIFEEAGVRIDVISATAAGYAVDIYFLVEDLSGERRFCEVEHFELHYTLTRPGGFPSFGISNDGSRGIIDRTEDGAVIWHSRTNYATPIEAETMTLQVHFLLRSYQAAEQTIDVDLAALTPQVPFDHLGDVPILQPHTHDIEIGL